MSPPRGIHPTGDRIESGTVTIKSTDRSASLGERLGSAFHSMTLGLPVHRLKLNGRHPLKLLTVPKDPVPGDKAAGEEMLRGKISFASKSITLKEMDFKAAPGSASFEHLQSFVWLRDLAAAATRDKGSAIAEHAVRQWLKQCGDEVNGAAWRADLWARRIFFWSAYAPYILSTRDLVYRSSVLNALAKGARHVERTAGKAPPGLQRITAWSGVITSALVLQGGPSRLGKGEAGLLRALEEALHEDGGLVSRSPAEQLRLVELIAQLRAGYSASRRDLPVEVAEQLRRAASALSGCTLGDGSLSAWQGGNMLSSRGVAAVLEAFPDARPLSQASGWGYHRLAAKKTIVIVDAAPPPPARAFNGGCASTLALEMSDGPHRLVVNCGGKGDGDLPRHIVQALRSTAAHSTLTFSDRNSTALHEDGTLGKGVTEVHVSREDAEGDKRLEASHDGYARRFGLMHRRRLEVSSSGLNVRGQDRLLVSGGRVPKEKGFAVRFHLAPHVQVTSTADRQGALLKIKGGAGWQFRCSGGTLSIEESLWVDGEGRPNETQQLVVAGELDAQGAEILWSLRRAG